MGRTAKIGIVVGGYVAAIAAANVAAWSYNRWAAAQPYDTSGGMYAAGEGMQALGAFLLVALVPTLLWLWFLRHNERFWNFVGMAAVAFAGVGLAAVVVVMTLRDSVTSAWGALFSVLGLAQLLGVPFWFAAFALFAVIAPPGRPRRKMVTAIALEGVIGVCALMHWFVLSR